LKIYLLENAHIITMDPNHPQAASLAIGIPSPSRPHDGRVLALGSVDDLRSRYRQKAQTFDLAGRVIIPGLTDAHVHLKQYAQSLLKVDCETPTRQACLDRVAERVSISQPGEWILGHGWSQNEWPEGFGSAADLDEIAPNNPVYLTAKSLHAGWVNSKAMKISGLHAGLTDPPDGTIGRDGAGNPDGILLEGAMRLIDSSIPRLTETQIADAIEAALPSLWKMGLTGVHDFDRQRCFAALQILKSRGELQLRVTKSIPVEGLAEAIGLGLRSGFGDDLLRIGSIKAFADGALGPRTAAMLHPYEEESENFGMLLLDREEIADFGRDAAAHGLSLAVHAIGDRANHEVISAFHQIRTFEAAEGIDGLRHRIEHVQILHPEDLTTLEALDVVASMQPIHAISDMTAADRYWGERTKFAYGWRMLIERGIRLAFGSDAPVDSPNPFWGLHAAVTRRRPDGYPHPEGWHPKQKLTITEALAGYTTGPAYQAGMEDRLGKLAPGFLADLVVLEDNPLTCSPEKLHDLHPVGTMIGGDWVYKTF